MPTSQMSTVIQQLHKSMLVQEAADGQLLECFVSRHEEAALEVLVRRHGPMVWGVCRRILGNHHDAEDAFQATFLVVVRKAASIAPKEMVGNWLYGVAHQTALKARATAAKRKKRECQVTTMPEANVAEQEIWCDLQPLLDRELSKLPDKYRMVILLCDLEGKTRKEAARQIDRPEGTVATWLARGRVLLAKRLARHGLAVSGGSVAAVLAQNASAGVPAAVMSSTINAVTRFAAGQGAMISVEVIALTEGVLRAMFLTKLKTVMTVLLVVGMTVFGGGLLTYHLMAQAQPGQAGKPADAKEAVKTDKEKRQAKEEGKQKESDTAPKEFDPKVVETWKKAGAKVGWYQRSKFGSWHFVEEKPKDLIHLPAFSLKSFEPGMIVKLPAPSVSFALVLRTGGMAESGMTDAGLKELAGLKSLQALDLDSTKVTDVGLKELVGFKSLQILDLGTTKVTDVGLKELAGLKSLHALNLGGTRQVTDVGLKEFAGLKSLQILNLWGTGVTDTGLKELAGLKSLQVLNLAGTQVTDRGLTELAGFKSLQILDLAGAYKVTDGGLKLLAGLKNLQNLELTGTKVTDTGLKELAPLKSLQVLGLAGTRVTDAGLKELAGFKSLYSLYLTGPQITDVGLKELAALKSLRILYLTQTGVTDAGVAQLRKIHPNLVIAGRR